MKLVSKKEPVKSVAPYVWGAKYLVLDSVPKHKAVEAGETALVTSVWHGAFKAYSEHNYDYINPEHLKLIDPAPQAEQTSETVYTVELTESELQVIVTTIEQSLEYERVFSARFTDLPEEVADVASGVYTEILQLLKGDKSCQQPKS